MVVIVLLSITLFNPRLTARSRDVLDLVHGSKLEADNTQVPKIAGVQKQDNDEDSFQDVVEETQENDEEKDQEILDEEEEEEEVSTENVNGPHWLRYKQ